LINDLLQKLDELEHKKANAAAAAVANLTSLVHYLGLKNLNPSANVEMKDPAQFLPYPSLQQSDKAGNTDKRIHITEKTKTILHRLVQERRIPIHAFMRMSTPPRPSPPAGKR
jgi:hypothetical protein